MSEWKGFAYYEKQNARRDRIMFWVWAVVIIIVLPLVVKGLALVEYFVWTLTIN